ncbi:MAG TPA: transporter substrate-binding domain-containing protein [Anaerolineae bacterium]|nr:transporter substrate-binding domain-containing protein [Anaerolineae bacterium]
MRTNVKLILIVLLSIVLASCTGGVETEYCPPSDIVTDLEGRTINVAVENAYPPYNFIDTDTNEGAGWDYDSVRAICDVLNCEPNFVEAAWDGIFEATAAGEYDMVADGVTCSGDSGAERDQVVDFSLIYGSSSQSIVVRIDETEITDEASLIASDAIVGTQIGTTNEARAIELVGEDRVLSYDTFDLPITALIAGDVNAVIMDQSAAEGFLAQNPDDIMVLPDPVTGAEMFCFVFPPCSDLIGPINYALGVLEADGSLDTLEAKWWPQE